MEFSINYSPPAAQLLREGKVRIDRFKCADWPGMIAEARAVLPVYVHFPLDAGSPGGRLGDLDAVGTMARDTDTPFVNVHLVSYARDFADVPVDSESADVRGAVGGHMSAQLARLCGRFGADRVIAENIPYYGPGPVPASEFLRACAEPEVITRAVERAGCGLLLDLSHARIAARYLGVDEREYVRRLPVHRLRELHVTGIAWHEGRWEDHMAMTEEDFAFTEWAMDQIRAGRWARPWLVALEYGGTGEPFKWRTDPAVIAEQAPRLRQMAQL